MKLADLQSTGWNGWQAPPSAAGLNVHAAAWTPAPVQPEPWTQARPNGAGMTNGRGGPRNWNGGSGRNWNGGASWKQDAAGWNGGNSWKQESGGWNGGGNGWKPEAAGAAGAPYWPTQSEHISSGSRTTPPQRTKMLRNDSYGDSPFASPDTPPDSMGRTVAPPPIPASSQLLHSLPLHSPALLGKGAMGPSPALSFEVLRPHQSIASKGTSPLPRVPPPPPNDNFAGLGSPRLVEEDLSGLLGKARIWSAPTMEPEAQLKKSLEPGKPPTINYKGELNHIAQHVLKQPLTGKDVVFFSESDEDGLFRCTVTLPWNGNRAFRSQIGFVKKKDAEQRAAEVAVRELVREGVAPAETVSNLPQPGMSPVMSSRLDGRSSKATSDNEKNNCKGELNNLAMKLLKRPVADGDVGYLSQITEQTGEYRCSLRLAWWMNWSFESMQTAKKKDAEQLAARIASDALVASAKSDRKPKQSEAPKPVRRVTLGRLVNRCLQVMDQPGMITWEGKFGPDDSVEVDLTVPWAWASAPNGMLRFCVKPDDEGIGQEKLAEALAALQSSGKSGDAEESLRLGSPESPYESNPSEVVENAVDAEGDEAASKGGKDSDKDSEKDLVPGKYANFLSAMLDLTDAEDEATTLKDAGNVAYLVHEVRGEKKDVAVGLNLTVTWPSTRGDFVCSPQPSQTEAEAATAQIACRHVLARIAPKVRRTLNKESEIKYTSGKDPQSLPHLVQLVLGRPPTNEEICWSPVVPAETGSGFIARVTLPWWYTI
jgi:hypothetical protein